MKRVVCILACLVVVAGIFGCSSPGASSSDASGASAAAPAKISAATEVSLPQATWQYEVTFPDWDGTVQPSLATNSRHSFTCYRDQGTLYVTPAEGVQSFRLFVNSKEFDTSSLKPGSTYAIDISEVSMNGTNTVQVSNIEPADLKNAVTVDIPHPTVLDGGTLEEAGIAPESIETISAIIQSDIDQGFTSAQLAIVKDGKVAYQNSWGVLNSYNQDGTPATDSAKVTNDTLYDLASNTKMYSVNYALQHLVTLGQIDLDTKVVDIIGQRFANDVEDITFDGYDNPGIETEKQWKSSLTLRDILRHQGGFPADPQYYNDKFNQQTQKADPATENVLYSGSAKSPDVRQKTLEAICKTPLMYEPGTKTLYSDVDYMLLCFVIEQVTGKDLQTYLSETFWNPMGLDRITYQPLEHGFTKNDCAATELNGDTRDGAISFTDARTETIQGVVHDGKAYHSMDGISGHAGMFSSATDLAKLASVMLTGGYGTNGFFSRDVIDEFTAPKREDVDSAQWGLGWWREADNARTKYFATESSSNTVGHQGWTGTLTMINPERNLVVVYLTNKINSPVTNKEADVATFNGGWYASASLGFVSQILFAGMDADESDLSNVTSALVADMVNEKFKLVDAEAAKGTALTADHPVVRSAYALLDVLFKRAEASGANADWELCKSAMDNLDSTRDAAEIDALSARLPQ